MPPKKGKTAATPTKAKAVHETAAASRPRRATTQDASAPTPAKKTAAKKAPAKKATDKAAPADATPATKKRGRPAKTEEIEAEEEEEDDPEPPKKRGRPPKAKIEETAAIADPPKKRGRPPKAQTEEVDVTSEPPKKRGRPSKGAAVVPDAPAVGDEEQAAPKKRGRPPKGGETTKIAADDPAAAEQLEEELVDAAVTSSKSAPPAKKKAAAKGKGRKVKSAATDNANEVDVAEDVDVDGAVGGDEEADANDEAAVESTGKQYWLMKAEQIDRDEVLPNGSTFNTKFTIDDLREKGGPEPWDGVRNPTAAKNMRGMKEGDLAFFYASGGKGKLQPGITGIMEIVKEHEPDMSAFDEEHPYYVKNQKQRVTKENPKWCVVHVEFRKKLSKPVALKELQKYKEGSGVLANMQEFTAARLSVSKVTEKEWNFIVDDLIEGYEDESTAAADSKEVEIADLPTAPEDIIDTAEPGITVNGEAMDQALPTSDTPTVEVNGTSRPPSRSSQKPSSRPTSRAPSRAASRAPSKAPSRAASLAPPPRAQSRGRSRTPASRAGSVKPMTGLAEEMETVDE